MCSKSNNFCIKPEQLFIHILFTFKARRQLSEFTSDQESIVSMAPITPPPSTGIMTHMGGPNVGYTNLGSTPGDRGSCSADSGVRGEGNA